MKSIDKWVNKIKNTKWRLPIIRIPFQSQSIRKKIMLSFGLVLLVSSGLAIYSMINTQKANELAKSLILKESQQLNALQDLRFFMAERLRLVNEYMLEGSPQAKESFENNVHLSTQLEDRLLTNVAGNKDEAAVKKVISDGSKWNEMMMKEAFDVFDNGEKRQALLNVGSEKFKAEQTMAKLKALADEKNKSVEQLGEEIISNGNQVQLWTMIFTFIVICISVIVAIVLMNSIHGPIRRLSERIQVVAEGDFSHADMKVTSNDEIGELTTTFNRMVKELRALISQAYETTTQVSASAEDLTASSEETAQGSESITFSIQEVAAASQKQLDSVNETIHTMNTLASIQETLTFSSEKLEASANMVDGVSKNGNKVVENAIKQMSHIHDSVIEVAGVIGNLGRQSKEISQITKVITGIADQTNLLALNAAIEAARAGEHGKGFSVVADEVRKLAVQSKSSSNEIIDLILKIQTGTNQAVKAMEKNTLEVENGSIAVNEAGRSFIQITDSITDIRKTIQSIHQYVQKMTESSKCVTANIEVLTEIAKVNSNSSYAVAASAEAQLATMEEIASSVQTVNEMAINLKEVLRKFTI
ncbi:MULTISPECIES: methyl-accepting chemotaxis protein [Robertmurraya]|uniref:Methyl-accepting chemotaxis protein n=1 Tax=Robertmurraya beringensis TaxID=641660 RepID=A0ABV6L1D3_9BACI